jgi:hypothetical protein
MLIRRAVGKTVKQSDAVQVIEDNLPVKRKEAKNYNKKGKPKNKGRGLSYRSFSGIFLHRHTFMILLLGVGVNLPRHSCLSAKIISRQKPFVYWVYSKIRK